ncbi:hypothetical protein EJ05DRAFT_501598 [Pseudovirgaria hyperparasitica]|uniref:Cation chloride cotransporter n=1 Tax=Pseudovirgaria hyperparasitica TaxID=470096 RepID=A0A6A6W674_9PEZI|nr:uncharacterized protein EJ05DRAFT_501598 [Pseudovirgaria hyperparasitica]KAF2757057.1 hypothetical protein EJ05DRAFT_501598 [Pseudovirgaria hyperparasitica]
MAYPDNQSPRRMPPRTHSNFMARTALDNASQLNRRGSVAALSPSPEDESGSAEQDALTLRTDGFAQLRSHTESHMSYFSSFFNWSRQEASSTLRHRRPSTQPLLRPEIGHHRRRHDVKKGRSSSYPNPSGTSAKLGTFAGAFVPTSLNVLSILMFLRFGFITGQAGLVGTLVHQPVRSSEAPSVIATTVVAIVPWMLIACYAINLLTTIALSAIATNGTVRGGGAYYLISRSLGPEFGGSIGIVFYAGNVFNCAMNAVGLVDCFVENFGATNGNWSQWMPDDFWYRYIWSTVVLIMCTAICLAGSGLFTRASNGLLLILLLATFSIPFSTLIVAPFENLKQGVEYTGLRVETLRQNLFPHFTKGAAGSQLKTRETWQDLFGILFPATGGIFAGASMSGDLKHPSKAIPKGTLYGLLLTFISYFLVILSLTATITRESLRRNTNVIQLTNVSEVLVFLGEIATSLFSSLLGVIGSAKLLQALSRDNLLPGLGVFSQGTKKADEPTYAILFTYLLAQATMLFDINQIASLITMIYLMTFLSTNLACFLLKISSAPNFRPSFRYFSWPTAAAGTLISGATMFFVDGIAASVCVVVLITIFVLIHYTTPPKTWGDVSQSLIYHQVRKYLLRLRPEHVKFWRPQILLLINDPRKQYKLIQFCNSLKKGALFILGHVIITPDFSSTVPEARRQQATWTKYIDFSRIKAFVNIAVSPALEWGARNLVLSAGLGGMRPNIVVLGFYNLTELRESIPIVDLYSSLSTRPGSTQEDRQSKHLSKKAHKKHDDKLSGVLPTDLDRREHAISASSYVTVLEDLLLRLKINVAVAKGFHELELPGPKPSTTEQLLRYLFPSDQDEGESAQRYIDLWPIQMSATTEVEDGTENGKSKHDVLTTNFDTYTLILQLGCILTTVPSYARTFKLRVIVFVEYESDVEEERGRVVTLLSNLRINAEVLVLWLASGQLKTYEIIINGSTDGNNADAIRLVDDALSNEDWWQDVERLRGRRGSLSTSQELASVTGILDATQNWPDASFQYGRQEPKTSRFDGLRKMIRRVKGKSSVGQISHLGVNLGMRTQRLPASLVSAHSSGEDSSPSDSDDSTVECSDSDEHAVSDEDVPDDSRSVSPRQQMISAGSLSSRHDGSPKTSHARLVDGNGSPSHEQNAHASPSNSILGSSLKGNSINSGTSTPRRLQNLPKFTAKTQPKTKLNPDADEGPSIMFDSPSPDEARNPGPSIYDRTARAAIATVSPANLSESSSMTAAASTSKTNASGFPSMQSIPLSFNDLPSRAQHLILNELISQNSAQTAVIFTTLPSPTEGTGESELDSISYLSDLEVLTLGLPPTLLVHSNSLTVTMNL